MPELRGNSDNGWAIWGGSPGGTGVVGTAGTGTGMYGESTSSYGVFGKSASGAGVVGDNASSQSPAVWGHNRGSGDGVVGTASTTGVGVRGTSTSSEGVFGVSQLWDGVRGYTYRQDRYGLYASNRAGGVAALIDGSLVVINGSKQFKIDHPVDPRNKYLFHHSVESSERKNVYDGIVQLDQQGSAWVDLPEWFEALNGDLCYQLTAVGGPAPDLHVAEEVSENRFKIAGGQAGIKVCWQLTGTRKDAWAAANPFEVEKEKTQDERGRYLQPELYNAPAEQGILLDPEEESPRRMDSRAEPPPPPQVLGMPLGVAAPGFGRLEEENRRHIEELRGQIEELRRKP